MECNMIDSLERVLTSQTSEEFRENLFGFHESLRRGTISEARQWKEGVREVKQNYPAIQGDLIEVEMYLDNLENEDALGDLPEFQITANRVLEQKRAIELHEQIKKSPLSPKIVHQVVKNLVKLRWNLKYRKMRGFHRWFRHSITENIVTIREYLNRKTEEVKKEQEPEET